MNFPFLSTNSHFRPFVRAPFDRVQGRQGKPKAPHLIVGEEGEELVCGYLRSIGYDIRARNVRIEKDEIDIIAWDPRDEVLVFVEVKTRTEKTQEGFHQEAQAGRRKRAALRRAVRRWVAQHDFDGGYRIDLVCVENGNIIRHFEELAWD